MSISLPGKLRVKRLNGANGPFCVGDLETEIGDFRVKDAILDQFDEGLYEGQFCIQQIFPWSYTAYGRMVIEIRAKLADLQIDGHTLWLARRRVHPYQPCGSRTEMQLPVSRLQSRFDCEDRIEIRGFGSFALNYRPPRTGRNPKTGEKVAVGAKRVPHFKAGKELRERIEASAPREEPEPIKKAA